MNEKRVVIIGAGASGYFAAIRIKELSPQTEVVILEKTGKTLSKLRISGGGRCNVTHNCMSVSALLQNYPRGRNFLKKIFHDWSVKETVEWFENHGVALKTEDDGRMFPVTDTSETVAQLLEWKAKKLGVELKTNTSVVTILPMSKESVYRWQLNFNTGGHESATHVILSVGGFSKESQYNMISQLGIEIVPPVPSLFTFNIPDKTLHALYGLSVQDARVKLTGYPEAYEGPLLITHWGLSGPAVLKTSAWAARWLNEKQYCSTALVSWRNCSEEEMRMFLSNALMLHPKKRIDNIALDGIPRRLWDYILLRASTPVTKMASELSKSEFNKIIENLCRMSFDTDGRTVFKEEFVTAGGIQLDQVNPKSMEIKSIPGLYAVGEVLDIDGVTGGFNFQAAWTTAAVAAKALSN